MFRDHLEGLAAALRTKTQQDTSFPKKPRTFRSKLSKGIHSARTGAAELLSSSKRNPNPSYLDSAPWRNRPADIVISTEFLRFLAFQASFFVSAMNAQALNARLPTLFESLKQTQQLISRLSKLPAQPGSSPSSPEEGDARVELGAEIHQSLKEQEEDFELLRQEFEDQTNVSGWSSGAKRRDSARDREKTDLASQVTRLGEDLKMYDCMLELHGDLH